MKPLTEPMRIVLVRMADPAWATATEGTGLWLWHPRGQERLILQGLANRGLVETRATTRAPRDVVLTATGATMAADLMERGVTIDG